MNRRPDHGAVFAAQAEHLIQDLYSAGLRLHELLEAATAARDGSGEPDQIRSAIGHLDEVLRAVTGMAFARRRKHPDVRPCPRCQTPGR